MWQTYFTPTTISQALALLSEHGPAARIVAGGTDLLLELERGTRHPRVIIDITRIPDLDRIHLDDEDRLHVGPLVTHNHIAGSELCQQRAFPLAKACWEVGAPQIRNRGTLAGNLITASPANDAITPLWALDGLVTLQSTRGTRSLTLGDFFHGVRKTDLRDDEMLVDISFAAMPANQRGTFLKLGLRQAQAISVVNVAVVITFHDRAHGGASRDVIADARITLGSVAPTITRAREAEQALVGQVLSSETIDRAADLAPASAHPIDDIRGSAAYRKYMVATFVRRALRQIRSGAESDQFPARPVMLWGASDGHFPAWTENGVTIHTADGDQMIETTVNGKQYRIRGGNDKTLLRLLREDIGLTGTKEGCAEGECGACTVFLDGIAVMSCLVPAPRAHDSQIVTIEGLGTMAKSHEVSGAKSPSVSGTSLHPLQQAFIDTGAVQCGYCTPGFIMSGASLLDEKPSPGPDEIRHAITGNLCRCTGYYSIISAIEKAAESRL